MSVIFFIITWISQNFMANKSCHSCDSEQVTLRSGTNSNSEYCLIWNKHCLKYYIYGIYWFLVTFVPQIKHILVQWKCSFFTSRHHLTAVQLDIWNVCTRSIRGRGDIIGQYTCFFHIKRPNATSSVSIKHYH